MTLPGVGVWTADVYLLACLGRPDLWPVGDRALQVAAAEALGLVEVPDRRAGGPRRAVAAAPVDRRSAAVARLPRTPQPRGDAELALRLRSRGATPPGQPRAAPRHWTAHSCACSTPPCTPYSCAAPTLPPGCARPCQPRPLDDADADDDAAVQSDAATLLRDRSAPSSQGGPSGLAGVASWPPTVPARGWPWSRIQTGPSSAGAG